MSGGKQKGGGARTGRFSAPSPAPATGKGAARALAEKRAEEARRKRAEEAARRVRAAGEIEPGSAILPPAPGREDDRPEPEFRDLTEPDELELWMGEQLRDWQLLIGAETLGQLHQILAQTLDSTKGQRAGVHNDLRQEGYLDGQINILETVIQQLERAIKARRDRVGEPVRRDQ